MNKHTFNRLADHLARNPPADIACIALKATDSPGEALWFAILVTIAEREGRERRTHSRDARTRADVRGLSARA